MEEIKNLALAFLLVLLLPVATITAIISIALLFASVFYSIYEKMK